MLNKLTAKIHQLLIKNRLNIATAESCTAGLLSTALTSLSGSSQYFILGITAYHNSAKTKLLNIPRQLITKHGAVSEMVARKMARNVAKLAQTDLGVGITGIAGPAGGTKAKPIGTVFIAVATKNKTICKRFNFKGNRTSIRKQATTEALKIIKTLAAGHTH